MVSNAVVKILFLLLIIWSCDAKKSSVKTPSIKKNSAATEKVDITTTTTTSTEKPEDQNPSLNSDPVVLNTDTSADEEDDSILDLDSEFSEDENGTLSTIIVKKITSSRKCHKKDKRDRTEVYSKCDNNECQNTCRNPLASVGCVGSCISGCICSHGYLRDDLGRCVLPSQCGGSAQICSGPNEVFSNCGNDGCQASCNRLTTFGCISACGIPACVCAAGFVRNAEGICILPSSCPSTSCTGQNERFSNCGNDGCQRTCTRLDVRNCQPICTGPACICQDGYVRNNLGICVLPSFCTGQTCTGSNEVFSPCGEDGCQRSCNRFDVSGCQPICATPRCICATGFVRNAAGLCVLPSSCPPLPCSGANEIFSFCGNDGCQRTCTRLDVTGCVSTCNTPRCVCAPDFVRNSAGACVPPEACPSTMTCGTNEVFSTCGNDGCQRSCTRLDVATCVAVCTVPSCVCAVGFVRNIAGVCVLPSACPTTSCTGANEVFSACGNDGCQRTCTRLDQTGCVATCNVPSCICLPGYVRNGAEVCVLPTACSSTCPGANQVFSACGEDGCQRSCTRLDITGCVAVCRAPACICAPGYVRNTAGNCVLPSTCTTTTCTGMQIFSACGNDGCQPSCTNLVVTGCTLVCGTPGCICAPGYVMNAGTCILPTACPSTMCPGANQMFSACGNDGCQPSCTTPSVTGCSPTCTAPGCICIPGYVRNTAGNCVLPSACPTITCSGPNMVPSACGPDGCERTCSRLVVTGCVSVCTGPGCVCAAGFIRDLAGNCILPTSCPSTCTGANEIFSACGDDGCQRRCDRLVVGACTPTCVAAGCVCAPGFVRNTATGTCILPTACPATMCPQNQVFSACGNDGCQRSCTTLDVSACMPTCGTPACICATGFVMDSMGNCIAPSNCPTTACGANQVFSGCGNDGCRPSCTVPAPVGCVPMCTMPACICAPGFVLNSAMMCVAITECPPPACGANQIFSGCGEDGCRPSCTRPDTTGCVPVCSTPSCICAPGFVRNDMGMCVMPAQCPLPACTRPNEILSTCGNDGCQRTCQRLDLTGCVPICTGRACICAAGFVRNTAGDCIPLSQCPMTCSGANEIFSMCGNNVCQQTCTFNDPTCMGTCTPGCICVAGFLRDMNGVCIPAADCNNCGRNERIRTCGQGECDATCANPDFGTSNDCTTAGQCTMRCFCVPGHVRFSNGLCENRNACP